MFVTMQPTKEQKQLPRNTLLKSWLACQFVPVSVPWALIIETIVYSAVFNSLLSHAVFCRAHIQLHAFNQKLTSIATIFCCGQLNS